MTIDQKVFTFDEFIGKDTTSGLPPPYWYFLSFFDKYGLHGVFQLGITDTPFYKGFREQYPDLEKGLINGISNLNPNPLKTQETRIESVKPFEDSLYDA